MKVTFAYEPQGDDELKLEIGDIVEFLKDVRIVEIFERQGLCLSKLAFVDILFVI